MSVDEAVPPTATTPALAVDRLRVPFGTPSDRPLGATAGCVEGLVDVSMTVGGGQRLAIVGPSGAGKTTLLRALAGLAPVTGGRVAVRGTDVTAQPPERRDIVYLHQTPVLFEHLSVAENVAFPLRVRHVRDAAVRERVGAALAAVRLPGFERRAPHTLSGGQRHRVALARALAARPAVLLLDEPLSALDPALRDEVREAIADAHAGGRAERGHEGAAAMVLVTHDFDDAGLLADEVAVLLGGRIVQRAPPGTLFARPASLAVARLLGTYQVLPGRVRADGAVECALGVVPNEGPRHAAQPAGTAVVVAFRRDALRVTPAGAPACAAGAPAAARVVDVRHRAQGTNVLVRLEAVDGVLLEAPLDTRHRDAWPADSLRGLDIGAPCGVALDTRQGLVFPV